MSEEVKDGAAPDTATLRELLAAGTPGKWWTPEEDANDTEGLVFMGREGGFDLRDAPRSKANAALIVAAVNALPGLLDEVERLRGALESLRPFLPAGCTSQKSPRRSRRERLMTQIEKRNHDLDCWPTYYDAVVSGLKTYEVRKNDRFFQAGDTVTLHRLRKDKPHDSFYNPRKEYIQFRIGGLLQGGQFGIEPGYCVFSLLPLPSPPKEPDHAG